MYVLACMLLSFKTRHTPTFGCCVTGFLKLLLSRKLVCAFVCPPLGLLISSGVIRIQCDWLNKFYTFYMAAVTGIISRRGLRIEARRGNQPNKSKLALYKLLL